MRRPMVLTAVLLALIAPSSVTASAPPRPLTFEYTMAFTGPDTAGGTWRSSGAFTDQGSVVETFRISRDPAPTQVARGTRTLTGSGGTLVVDFVVRLTSSEGGVLIYEGPWHVRSGTGAYARMTGGGTFLAHLDVRSGAPVFTINRMEGAVRL